MAQQIRLFPREVDRRSRSRRAWRIVRRSQVRLALQALEALYRKG